jgi:plasmid stabilization system protein ParE
MRARFHPEARLDFKNAAAHYAAIRPDLGQGFYRHIDGLIADIEANPTLFRVYRPPLARRHFRRPFPYAIVYFVLADEVFVVAVLHFKQPPSYWLHRLAR